MPKLGKKDSWKAKKEQILGMYYKQLFENLANNPTRDSLPDYWEKEQVEKFYEEIVTEELVEKYQDILEKQKKDEQLAKQAEEEEKVKAAKLEAHEKMYEETKPVEVSAGVEELKARLQGLDLPEDEYDEILKTHEAELEIKKLEHEGKFHKLDYKKDYGRLNELNKKFGDFKIGAELDEIAEDKKRLNSYQDELAKYDKPPKKPGRFAQMWNDFQKKFTGSDIRSVQAYNHYTDVKVKVAELEETILYFDEHFRKRRDGDDKVDSYVKNKAHKPYELAEHIVRESIKNLKESVPELSKEEFRQQVDKVMDSKAFKELVVDLKVDRLDIKLESFHKAYMKKTSLIQKEEEKQRAESAPERQKEVVKEAKQNKSQEGPQLH